MTCITGVSRTCLITAALMFSLGAPSFAGGSSDQQGQSKSAKLTVVDFNADGEKRVQVSQSQVTLVEIAMDHINRVITPFERPEVWTSSSAEIQASSGVLYIQPTDATPVSLFITEAGREEFAINITLVPRSVPPVELYLDLDRNVSKVLEAAYAQEAAIAAQARPTGPSPASTSQREPWFDTIKSALTSMAIGQVPRSFAQASPGAPPVCATGHGFEASFAGAQWYRSNRFEVIVGRAINRGPAGEFKEFWCAGDRVAAVSVWPSAQLQPGGVAEVMVLRHLGTAGGAAPVRTRPSLIGE